MARLSLWSEQGMLCNQPHCKLFLFQKEKNNIAWSRMACIALFTLFVQTIYICLCVCVCVCVYMFQCVWMYVCMIEFQYGCVEELEIDKNLHNSLSPFKQRVYAWWEIYYLEENNGSIVSMVRIAKLCNQPHCKLLLFQKEKKNVAWCSIALFTLFVEAISIYLCVEGRGECVQL